MKLKILSALPGSGLKFLLLWLPVLLAFPGMAQQKQTEHQKLLWLRYALNLGLTDKLDLANEIEDRRFVFPGKQHQLLFRSTLLYKFPNELQPGIGFTYFLQSPHDPESASDLMVPELRPHQELNYRSKLGERWSVRQRFKLEERFFHKAEKEELKPGYDFNFRFRIKLDLFYTLLQTEEEKDRLVLTVSDEVMFNAGKRIVYNVFDQNRVYAGLRWYTGANTSLEGGYLWWYQQRADGESYYSRNILRLTFYQKLNLARKDS